MARPPEAKSPLRPYQADGAIKGTARIRASGGFYIQHPPGAGKTLTAIAIARLLKAERIAVVCPLVAIGVWHREVGKWWPVADCHPVGDGYLAEDYAPQIRVVNYDKLASDRAVLNELCAWAPDVMIADEGHYAKDITADRTKAVMKLADNSAATLYLSGTPAHSPFDWWAQMRVIARDEPVFKMNYTAYKQAMCVMGGPNGNWPMKDKKTGQLRIRQDFYNAVVKAMEPYIHTAEDALNDLEEPVYQEIPYDLDEREHKVYDDMSALLRAELDSDNDATAEIQLTKLLRLSQIAAGHVTSERGETFHIGHSRENALAGLLEQHAEEKVVIATRFREDVNRIKVVCKAAGRRLRIIDGDTTGPERTVSEDWFQSAESPADAVIVLQYQAGGVAITLTAAKTLILYTLDPSVIRWRQMIGRIWRIGQRGLCRIYTLTANGTQDSLMSEALQRGFESVDLARVLRMRLSL